MKLHSLRAIVFALAVLAICASVSAQAPSCNGPGKERWPIKTSVPDSGNLSASKPIGLNDLLALVQPAGVKHNDSRYASARIPAFANSLSG